VGAPIPFTIFNKIFAYFSKDFLLHYLGFSVPVWGYLLLLGWFTVRYLKDSEPDGFLS
jgi:hypothetical protein